MKYQYCLLTLVLVACATDPVPHVLPVPAPTVTISPPAQSEDDYVILTPEELNPPFAEPEHTSPPTWNGDFVLNRRTRSIDLVFGQISFVIYPDKDSDGRLDIYPIPPPWNDRFTQIEVTDGSVSATMVPLDVGIDCTQVVAAQPVRGSRYRLLPTRPLFSYGADCGRPASIAIAP